LAKKATTSTRETAPSTALKGRIGQLIGKDRRARLLTLATVAALLAAVLAFLVLDASHDGSDLPQDAYARAVDAACVQRKGEIARAQRAALGGGGFAAVSRFADSVVPVAGEWRQELGRGAVPSNRAALVDALAAALLEVQIEAGTLARAARESNSREIAKVAARMDAATANVEAAVDSLDLPRCGQLAIERGQLIRR
jgi:hypothetical protein